MTNEEHEALISRIAAKLILLLPLTEQEQAVWTIYMGGQV